jgi:hypothetical protein
LARGHGSGIIEGMASPRIPRVTPKVLVPRVASPPLERLVQPPIPPKPVAAPRPDEPIARVPPPGLGSKELAAWHVGQIHAHERLRTLSFYDTGHHLMQLLELRAQFGARDIKELCSKVGIGMSHMTANKYMQIARAFDRQTALEAGIEKCYALTVYAKATGRAGQAAAILAADEAVRGASRLRVKGASASKLYAAVRALKEARKAGREPTEIQAARAKTAQSTEVWLRKLGFRGAQAEIVRRRGEAKVAIYLSLEVAEALEPSVLGAFAKLGPKIAKTRPELFAPLRAAGWKLTGSG